VPQRQHDDWRSHTLRHVVILDGEGRRVIGTIDVESERVNAFDSATQASLEGCAHLLKSFWINSDQT
jgi:putative methionine-R-sulfoxide reductase with GAF domain